MPPIREYFSLKRRYLSEKAETVHPFKTFHIMCEGTVSEIKYFKALKNCSHINIRNGIIVKLLERTENDTGRTQLNEMYKLMIDHMNGEEYNDGDQAVLLVDFDVQRDNTDFENQIRDILEHGIQVFGNSPCFELWYILHIENSVELHIKPHEFELFSNQKVSTNHTYASKKVSDLLGFNPKNNLATSILDHIHIAINQAPQLENDLLMLNKKIGTNTHLLIKSIIIDERFD